MYTTSHFTGVVRFLPRFPAVLPLAGGLCDSRLGLERVDHVADRQLFPTARRGTGQERGKQRIAADPRDPGEACTSFVRRSRVLLVSLCSSFAFVPLPL